MLQAQIGKYQDTCIFFFYNENLNPEATRYIINFDKLYVTQSVEFWLWICPRILAKGSFYLLIFFGGKEDGKYFPFSYWLIFIYLY